MRTIRRFVVRVSVLVTALAAAALGLAAGAEAHVTVTAPGAIRGGSDQEITFRVPVEKNIDTVGLTVSLPSATPIASVLVEPVPGWSHTQKSSKLAKPIVTDDGSITTAVSQITWTARHGRGLAPGEFGVFTVIAGQLPDTASLTFRALQTYADGSVVPWNEVAAPGSKDEPDNPAPVLSLAPNNTATTSSAATSSSATSSSAASTRATSGGSDAASLTLSIVALVVAVAALAVTGRATRRRAGGPDRRRGA